MASPLGARLRHAGAAHRLPALGLHCTSGQETEYWPRYTTAKVRSSSSRYYQRRHWERPECRRRTQKACLGRNSMGSTRRTAQRPLGAAVPSTKHVAPAPVGARSKRPTNSEKRALQSQRTLSSRAARARARPRRPAAGATPRGGVRTTCLAAECSAPLCEPCGGIVCTAVVEVALPHCTTRRRGRARALCEQPPCPCAGMARWSRLGGLLVRER